MPKVLWLNKHPVAHPDDIHRLEQRSALLEFHGGLPRDQAEAAALKEYQQEHHAKAGAHHYAGMRAALAVGDQEGAKQHHAMYTLHLKRLGLDPNGAVPPAIQIHQNDPNQKFYQFRPHPADEWTVSDQGQK